LESVVPENFGPDLNSAEPQVWFRAAPRPRHPPHPNKNPNHTAQPQHNLNSRETQQNTVTPAAMNPEKNILTPEALLTIAGAVEKYYGMYYDKTPCRTSALGGASYMSEIVSTKNLRRAHEVLRMPLSTFTKLCAWFREQGLLQDEKVVSVEEQVAIFMDIVGKKASNRGCQERFQHSGDTISRYFVYFFCTMICS
jgi:hypothetical protein